MSPTPQDLERFDSDTRNVVGVASHSIVFFAISVNPVREGPLEQRRPRTRHYHNTVVTPKKFPQKHKVTGFVGSSRFPLPESMLLIIIEAFKLTERLIILNSFSIFLLNDDSFCIRANRQSLAI